MLRFVRVLIAWTCVSVLPVAAYAQASITGVVKDASGAVLPGVTVEAASPALIEKVRTAVTDGTGQYRIVDLRPGTYSVQFTLQGFSVVKREGIELEGAFAATVNADLRVGSLEETITVTGESPIVDVQNTRHQQILDNQIVNDIPSGRSYHNLAVLVPGLTVNTTQDVGGIAGPGDRHLLDARRPQQRRPPAGGRHGRGRRAGRRRRVVLRPRCRQRGGNHLHDLGRPW